MHRNSNITDNLNSTFLAAGIFDFGHLQHIDFQCLFSCKNALTFTGKEKDSETGFYYFWARYYDPSISGLFLSVDPMSDKYPSLSPYAYCAWNPVKLVDPDGMEVEYSSLMDRVFVFIERIANKGFRQRYNDLKKSDETYVFKHNNEGNNVLTTDGEKLYINYSADQKQKDGEGDGSTVFSVLRHETEHAVQFEYGELGFGTNEKGEWKPFNFDIHDEIRARDFEASNKIGLNAKALHNLWGGFIDTYEKKIVALKEICRQNNKPMYEMSKLHNGNEKVKNSNTFALPYKERGY